MTNDCDKIRDSFSDLLDGLLEGGDRDRVMKHIADCADCAKEWASFKSAVGAVRALPKSHAPASLKDAVMREIVAGETTFAAAAPVRKRIFRLMPLPVAATLIVALGMGLILLQSGSRRDAGKPLLAMKTDHSSDKSSKSAAMRETDFAAKTDAEAAGITVTDSVGKSEASAVSGKGYMAEPAAEKLADERLGLKVAAKGGEITAAQPKLAGKAGPQPGTYAAKGAAGPDSLSTAQPPPPAAHGFQAPAGPPSPVIAATEAPGMNRPTSGKGGGAVARAKKAAAPSETKAKETAANEALTWRETPKDGEAQQLDQAQVALAPQQQARIAANIADVRGSISEIIVAESADPSGLAARVSRAVEGMGGSAAVLQGREDGDMRVLIDIPARQKDMAVLATRSQLSNFNPALETESKGAALADQTGETGRTAQTIRQTAPAARQEKGGSRVEQMAQNAFDIGEDEDEAPEGQAIEERAAGTQSAARDRKDAGAAKPDPETDVVMARVQRLQHDNVRNIRSRYLANQSADDGAEASENVRIVVLIRKQETVRPTSKADDARQEAKPETKQE
ncbi:MAG TPA: zf-HC2 domain-containing protein [Candidatus Brocadiia bacterium]|nr:zf-HC2 domain-containing protein [Candidatus Brocadiia bacterium]